MTHSTLSFLALGDSYTIGEAVPGSKNFPNQTAIFLREKGIAIDDPVIIAKTGWTTDELAEGIVNTGLDKKFDLVTLLIGVNNQYRDRPGVEYAAQFEQLLKKAIAFAANKKEQVYVLSIPDWGATPFAAGKDRNKISSAIDAFNAINKKLAAAYHVNYIDITPWTREALHDRSLLAEDLLHPSEKEYERWAVKLAEEIIKRL